MTKVKEYTLEMTIGLPEYSNVKPSVTLTDIDSFESAHLEATKYLAKVWEQYGKNFPASVSTNDNSVELTDYFGNKIRYDPDKHEYSWEGVRYLSGSEYSKSFEKPFDAPKISEAMAKRDGVRAEDLIAQWALNGDVSRGLGTALHNALELYGRFGKLHDNLMLKTAVSLFYEAHKEKAEYEVLVVDHANKRAGRIDRIEFSPKGVVVVDFKTGSVEKKLPIYTKQLSFYAALLKANKQTVIGARVDHWDGEVWKPYDIKLEEV